MPVRIACRCDIPIDPVTEPPGMTGISGTMTKIEYRLGHGASELRRLELQAVLARPITSRLLEDCGLGAGMRVLDIGSGAGDVAMLAAELVGPTGRVVGIDRSAEVIQHARSRAEIAGLGHLDFRVASLEESSDFGSFDLVVGRFVLLHQADQAAFLRKAVSFVRRGGCVGFIEPAYDVTMQMSMPAVPLYEQIFAFCVDAFMSVGVRPNIGHHFVELFHKAGLEEPALAHDVPTGGPNSQLVEWLSLSLQSLLPHLERIGATTAAALETDTLHERLRKAASVAPSQLSAVPFISAWARVAAR
jgi:ubiquinone/menaquinone biosynthesis C-methylase UbiE